MMKNLLFLFFISFSFVIFSQHTGKINIYFPKYYEEFDNGEWPVHIIIHSKDSIVTGNKTKYRNDDIGNDYELAVGSYDLKMYYKKGSDKILWQTLHDVEIVKNNTTYIEFKGSWEEIFDWKYDSLDKFDTYLTPGFNYGPFPNIDETSVIKNHFCLESGIMFLSKYSKYYGLGFNLNYGYAWSNFSQDITIPSSGPHQKERYSYLFYGVGLTNRFTFYNQQIVDNGGIFVDLGINYTLPIFFRYVTVNDNVRTIERKLHGFNDLQGVLNIGFRDFSISANYRFFDVAKNNYPSLPKLTLGLKFQIEN